MKKPSSEIVNPLLKFTPFERGLSISLSIGLEELRKFVSEIKDIEELNSKEFDIILDSIESKIYRLSCLNLEEDRRYNIEQAEEIIENLRDIPSKIPNHSLKYIKELFREHLVSFDKLTSSFSPLKEGKIDFEGIDKMIIMMEEDYITATRQGLSSPMLDSWCDHINAAITQLPAEFMAQPINLSEKLIRTIVIKNTKKILPLLSEIKSNINTLKNIRQIKSLFSEIVSLWYNRGTLETDLLEKIYGAEEGLGRMPLDELAKEKAQALVHFLDYLIDNKITSTDTAIQKEKLLREIGWEGFGAAKLSSYLNKLVDKNLIKYTKAGKTTYYYITKEGINYKTKPYFRKYFPS